jgi:hypothetical protein
MGADPHPRTPLPTPLSVIFRIDSKEALLSHILEAHSVDDTGWASCGWSGCKCGAKGFSSADAFVAHVNELLIIPKLDFTTQCSSSGCNRVFANSFDLNMHEMEHAPANTRQ